MPVFTHEQKQAIEFLVALRQYFKNKNQVIASIENAIIAATPSDGFDTQDINNVAQALETYTSTIEPFDQQMILNSNIPQIKNLFDISVKVITQEGYKNVLAEELLSLYHKYQSVAQARKTIKKAFENPDLKNNNQFTAILQAYDLAVNAYNGGNYQAFRDNMKIALSQLNAEHFFAIEELDNITRDEVKGLIALKNNTTDIQELIEYVPVYFADKIGTELVAGIDVADNNNNLANLDNNQPQIPVLDPNEVAKAEIDKLVKERLQKFFTDNNVPVELQGPLIDQALAVKQDAINLVDRRTERQAGETINVDQTVLTILTFAKVKNYYDRLDDTLKQAGLVNEQDRKVVIAFIFKQYQEGIPMEDTLKGTDPFVALKNWAVLQPNGAGLTQADVEKLEKFYGDNKERVDSFFTQMDKDLESYKVSKQHFDEIKSFAYEKLDTAFKNLYDSLSIKTIDTSDPIGQSMTTEGQSFWAKIGQFFLNVLYVLGPILIDIGLNYLQSRGKIPGLDITRPVASVELTKEQKADAKASIYNAALVEFAKQKLDASEQRALRRDGRLRIKNGQNFDGFVLKSNEYGLDRKYETLNIKADFVRINGKRVKRGTIWATYRNEKGEYCSDKIAFKGEEAKFQNIVKLANGKEVVSHVKLGGEAVINSKNLNIKNIKSDNQFVWVGKNFVTAQYQKQVKGIFQQKVETKFVGYKDTYNAEQMFRVTVEFPEYGGKIYRRMENNKMVALTNTINTHKSFVVEASKLKDMYASNGVRFTYQKVYGHFETYVKDNQQYAINNNILGKNGFVDVGSQVKLNRHGAAFVNVTLHDNAQMFYKDLQGQWTEYKFANGNGNYQIYAWKLKTAMTKNIDLSYYKMGRKFVEATNLPHNNLNDNKKYMVVYSDQNKKQVSYR